VILGRSLWGGEISAAQLVLIALLLIGGAILCAVGIVGEYVGRIYEQVKGRPLYLLKETSPSLATLRTREPIPPQGDGKAAA